jgi:hypothetical protein
MGGVILLSVLFMSFSSPKAQAEYWYECNTLYPCLDSLYIARGDSIYAGWQYPDPIEISVDPNCPECKIDWHYRFRLADPACPDTKDVYEFISMVVNNGCFYPCPLMNQPCCANPPYENMPWEDMFIEAYFAGLTAFMEKLDLVNKGADSCGPVMEGYFMGNCKKYVDTGSGLILTDCWVQEQFCCEQKLQYCNGEATVLTTSGQSSYICGTEPNTDAECISMCLWRIGDVYKRSYSFNTRERLGIQIRNRVISNSLEFETEESGSVQLIIYDLNGSERLNQRVELSSNFNINVDFETGVYFYFLTSDDGRDINGQFIVDK